MAGPGIMASLKNHWRIMVPFSGVVVAGIAVMQQDDDIFERFLKKSSEKHWKLKKD